MHTAEKGYSVTKKRKFSASGTCQQSEFDVLFRDIERGRESRDAIFLRAPRKWPDPAGRQGVGRVTAGLPPAEGVGGNCPQLTWKTVYESLHMSMFIVCIGMSGSML